MSFRPWKKNIPRNSLPISNKTNLSQSMSSTWQVKGIISASFRVATGTTRKHMMVWCITKTGGKNSLWTQSSSKKYYNLARCTSPVVPKEVSNLALFSTSKGTQTWVSPLSKWRRPVNSSSSMLLRTTPYPEELSLGCLLLTWEMLVLRKSPWVPWNKFSGQCKPHSEVGCSDVSPSTCHGSLSRFGMLLFPGWMSMFSKKWELSVMMEQMPKFKNIWINRY